MVNPTTVIRVHLYRLDDWVVAKSDSPELRGLYLANPSYDAVVSQIPSAIKMLFKAQHRRDVNVKRFAAGNVQRRSTDTYEFIAEQSAA